MARRADVGDIVKELTEHTSRGVLIVGTRGTGKTWMLGRLREVLQANASIITLSASKALATIPFGAINARLGSARVRSSDHYVVLNGLLEQIHESATATPQVFLVVDNAEYLDSQSAAIISQVVMSSVAKLIVVDQPGGHKNYLRELWRDGHLTRFELAPLQTEDVGKYLEEFLGGKVSSSTAEYLAKRSAGNPLVLKGLIAGVQEEGTLHRANNMWVLDHPGDILGKESWDFIQMDLERLPSDSKYILEVIALGGPLPLDTLLELRSTQAIDDLQQRDMIEIVQGTELIVRLSREVIASAIRAKIPVGRSRQYFNEVSAFIRIEELDQPELVINFTRWSLECGLQVSEQQILAAATFANHLMRSVEALEFSNKKIYTAQSAALLAERSIANTHQNHKDEARRLALQSLDLSGSAVDGVRALRAVHLSFFDDMDYLVQMNLAFAEFERKFGTVTLTDSSNKAEIDALIIQATKDVTVGDVNQGQQRIEALLQYPQLLDVGDKVVLRSLLIEIFSASGQLARADALASEVISELENPEGFPRPDISILAYSRSVAAHIYEGAWDRVRAALEPATFTNPDLILHVGGLRDLATAMMACRRGHMEEVLAALEPAVGALTDYDPWSVLPLALGIKAYALVMRGDIPASQDCLDQLSSLNQRSGKFYEFEGAAHAAAARFLTGQSDLGLAKLRGLQRECETEGYLGIELTVLSLLLRVGDNSSARRLKDVARLIDSTTKEFFVSWADAMISQNPAHLDSSSAIAMDYGFELIAVELATHAHQKLNDGGRVHKSRKTASKVVSMRETMPGLTSPVFQSIDQPKMTRREHQIALLIAQGESNNSIATRLNVSLRTVEGHLYRTFIKLDIQSREQLASLMSSENAQEHTEQYYS